MAMGRLLVPGLPFTAILFGWILNDLFYGSNARKFALVALAVLFLLTGLLPAANIHVIPETVRNRFGLRGNRLPHKLEYSQWLFQKGKAEDWEIIGRTLKGCTNPSDTLVRGAIGAIGYYSGLYIYDRFGLVNREVASRNIHPHLASPGHDKWVELTYFMDKDPTIGYVALMRVSELHQYFAATSGKEYSDKYVADFVRAVGTEEYSEPMYLFMVRRIPMGVSGEVAWKKAWEALENVGG
jgi:hypothetical protein